jgi:hypothetical protein
VTRNDPLRIVTQVQDKPTSSALVRTPRLRDPVLPTFEKALLALQNANTVDDVLHIKDVSEAMRAYARQADDKTLQISAVELSMRASRKLGLLIDKQRKEVGLAKGGGDQRSKHRGVRHPGGPITYKEAGIKDHIAKEANRLATIPERDFDRILLVWRTEMVSAPRVKRLICRQYNRERYERRQAEQLSKEKEAWITKREGGELSREELAVQWEKDQATFQNDEDEYISERRLSLRDIWEMRLASNPTAKDKPTTLNSVHKIVADTITRLLALVDARAIKRPPTVADYERLINMLRDRVDDLYASSECEGH